MKRRVRDVYRKSAHIHQGAVNTPDGNGVVVSVEIPDSRRCRQLRVRLTDGRVRHYNPSEVSKTEVVEDGN